LSHQEKTTMKNLRLFIILLIVIVFVAVLIAWSGIWGDARVLVRGIKPEVYKAFAGVCTVNNSNDLPEQVHGVQQAAEFTGGRGPHPIIAFTTSGDLYGAAAGLPRGWNPASISATQLVLCVGDERLDLPGPVVPVCQHDFDHVPTRRAVLFAARTGKKLWTSDFYRYYSPCDAQEVDSTTLDAMASEIRTNIEKGNIQP
jgi:hypothetical protein